MADQEYELSHLRPDPMSGRILVGFADFAAISLKLSAFVVLWWERFGWCGFASSAKDLVGAFPR